MFSFSEVSKDLDSALAAEGLLHLVPLASSPFQLLSHQEEAPLASAGSEVSFVDDSARFLEFSAADCLLEAIPRFLSCVAYSFWKFALPLNFSSGKTEALLALRGPLSKRLRTKLFMQHEPGFEVVLPPSALMGMLVLGFGLFTRTSTWDPSFLPQTPLSWKFTIEPAKLLLPCDPLSSRF